MVTDGPFTETAEQVGGFYVVETDDVDDLLECCTIITAVGDGIEVRRTVSAQGACLVRRYVVLIAYEPGQWASASEVEREEYFTAHHAFEAYVDEHGRRLSSGALSDAETATTIRHVGGEVTVTDGPYVELVEQVGGYYDVELPDLDAAIAAGSLLPAAYAVEIRPTIVIEGYESV